MGVSEVCFNGAERMQIQEKAKRMTIREAAIALGLRSQSIYNLLRDDLLRGQKTESGGWLLDAESVERYRLRRNLRRASWRSKLQREAIDVAQTMGVHT
jgi:hypothetical protein